MRSRSTVDSSMPAALRAVVVALFATLVLNLAQTAATQTARRTAPTIPARMAAPANLTPRANSSQPVVATPVLSLAQGSYSGTYTITSPPTPFFSLAPGTYPSVQTVSIFDSIFGVTLYYTTDGSTPTAASAQYIGPIAVAQTESIQAIASGGGYTASPVASAAYTIAPPSAASQIGNWVWLSGSNQSNNYVNCGTLRSSSPAANPGVRAGMANWTDSEGNLWIFGGGCLLTGYNDVWEFNSTSMVWTWIAGPSTPAQNGVYGTLGSPSPNNLPGLRGGSVTWKDNSGNFWLFGGEGYDSAGNHGYLNDLWMFSPSTLQWTWMGGSNVLPTCPSTNSCGPPGVYGTLGTPSPDNVPPGRSDAQGWTDANGDFWLFGGRIYIVYLNGWGGYENDLWKYSPSTNQWTWMGGNSSLPSDCTLNDSCGYAGAYGNLLAPSTSNLPGAREDSTTWTDSSGNFWLLGGFGYDSAHIRGYLNDLWEFNPAAGTWEWVSGSNTVGAETYDGPAGIYGTKGSPSLTNVPGGREDAASWVDQNNNLWIFAGYGFGSDNSNGIFSAGYLNDLWEFNPATNEWTWMTGSNSINSNAAFGPLAIASAANDPGSRVGVAAWPDNSGNLWFFGGVLYASNVANGDMNDVWEYLLNGPPHAQPPSFSLSPNNYTGPQSVSLVDATPNATYYYTTDGSTPTVSSTPYSGAISVTTTQTINAIAIASGYVQSPVATATYNITPAIPVITWPAPAPITYGTALSTIELDATTHAPGTFAYNPPAGTVISAGLHTLIANFAPDPNSGYTGNTASVDLTVNPATPTISWLTPKAIAYGTALTSAQLNATASVPGTFAYTPAAGTVLTLGPQKLSVTFTPTDTTDYTTATDSVTLTVTQATPTIIWPTPAAITYGTALSSAQLDATASVAGTFAYSPTVGTVLGGGPQKLSVTFTPTDTNDYTTTTASVMLTVNQATPAITWPTPAPITYGIALSAAQLNATASVPGTFAYSPASGTVLGGGAQKLSVTFTPTDTTDYTTATDSVTLTVTQAIPTITLASSLNPSNLAQSVTFTATVSSPLGAPTGTVVFYDGTTPLGAGTLAAGVATYSTTALAAGSHSITAQYSGDANFAAITSTALTQTVSAFGVVPASGAPTTASAAPGSLATYLLSVTPLASGSVALYVTGMPSGFSAIFSPNPVPAGAGPTQVELTIEIPSTEASTSAPSQPGSSTRMPPAFALLLLPLLGLGRWRRVRRHLLLALLAVAALAATTVLSGCSHKFNSGGMAGNPTPSGAYSLTVTAIAGTQTQTTTLTLNVE